MHSRLPARDRRLSVCYVVPAHNLLPSAGPTRNVLSLAHALSEWADVTVAFRRVLEPVADCAVRVLEIEPGAARHARPVDDAAVRGIGYREFAVYLRAIRRFVDQHLGAFDAVLEKSWPLSGYISDVCRRRGIVAVPVENLVPVVNHAQWGAAKAGRNRVARTLAGRYLRRAPAMIAETEYLKAAIVDRWRVSPDRIEVVGLGVDRSLFRPLDQCEARQRLGIPCDATVLVYVGVLDATHDLRPVLQALLGRRDPTLRLEIVGDGALRAELEARVGAEARGAVRFRGRVPHHEVPNFIAAADLCLAPYEPRAFPNEQVGYSTLKVREYLAAGRPVATVPSGALLGLIRDGESGFLRPNDAEQWADLFRAFPSRGRLRAMGEAAAATPLDGWNDVARSYRTLLRRLVDRRGGPGRPA